MDRLRVKSDMWLMHAAWHTKHLTVRVRENGDKKVLIGGDSPHDSDAKRAFQFFMHYLELHDKTLMTRMKADAQVGPRYQVTDTVLLGMRLLEDYGENSDVYLMTSSNQHKSIYEELRAWLRRYVYTDLEKMVDKLVDDVDRFKTLTISEPPMKRQKTIQVSELKKIHQQMIQNPRTMKEFRDKMQVYPAIAEVFERCSEINKQLHLKVCLIVHGYLHGKGGGGVIDGDTKELDYDLYSNQRMEFWKKFCNRNVMDMKIADWQHVFSEIEENFSTLKPPGNNEEDHRRFLGQKTSGVLCHLNSGSYTLLPTDESAQTDIDEWVCRVTDIMHRAWYQGLHKLSFV